MALAHSFSALRLFETCPRKYYHERIAKDFKESQGSAAQYGLDIHKDFELYLLKKKPLPDRLKAHKHVIDAMDALEGEGLPEQRLAVDNKLRPTGFFSKNAWLRAVVDYAKVTPHNTALVVDWKTGKFKPDFEQVELCVAMLHRHRPEITRASAAYYWTKDRRLSQTRLTSDDIPNVWRNFLPRIIAIEKAAEADKFPCRPNGLCKNYCPVKTCQYNGL